MDRGLYTGALAMLARSTETEIISNNLANMNTVGFKQDTALFKDFPAMLLHRLHDEKVYTPLHVYDMAPPVGRVGTGVQVDDIDTTHDISQSYQLTSNIFDLALEGVPGVKRSYAFFEVQTPTEKLYTRAGNFILNSEGYLVTQSGSFVLGENGPVKLDPNNVEFQPDGTILTNPAYSGNGTNQWEEKQALDKLRIVSFENADGLEKVGYTLYRTSETSGSPESILFGVTLRSNMLEVSNVNPVREMTDLIKAQRAYEAAAKVVQTHDQVMGQAVNDVGRAS